MKKVFIFIMVVALILVLTPAIIYAAPKGPAEKVTGSIEIQRDDEKRAFAEFNAHEAIGDKSAKGEYHWWATNTDSSLFREVYINVTDVMVNGSSGYFKGICTYDSQGGANVGKWFLVEATDGGSPGAGNDDVGWAWFSSEPSFVDTVNDKTIIDGNLVVHSKPDNVVVSVVFSDNNGTGSYFGDVAGDVVTITFSSNITKVVDISAVFEDGYPIISNGALTDWDITDNVLTFTSNAVFVNPRPMSDNKLLSITGLVDSISNNPVVVPAGGVIVQ